jgi:phospholipid/cholesterol/gamma-HCH transport system substrate-binding protein
MAKRPARDVTVGAVFALALIILALTVMVVGGDSGLWFERAEFRIVFPDATGLRVGAPVRMAGVQIGTVSGILLPTDPTESGIEVRVAIVTEYAERVRADSTAALRILQFLTAEKYLEITPGSPAREPLASGSTIPRLVEVGVVERGEEIAESLVEVAASLKNILGPLERGEGLLGRLLQDPEFGEGGVASLQSTLANLSRVTGDVVAGKGTLGRLLYDEQLAAKLDGLGRAVDDVAGIARALSKHEGALGALLAEGGSAEQALTDLGEAAASLRRIASRLEDEDGLVGRLASDREYSEALADDLAAALRNAAEITRKIESGEGTFGALVNDPGLYEGVEDFVAGVNDSKFARWLARRYRKKAIREMERRETEDGPPGDSP